ncbi:hypothetical protein [Congregicoccus parvus]|uniref:hypothetical protein n=1 Tax=Congregicoccus parvus TaxID=3081749 RepID=UPI003FA5E9BD
MSQRLRSVLLVATACATIMLSSGCMVVSPVVSVGTTAAAGAGKVVGATAGAAVGATVKTIAGPDDDETPREQR